VRSMTCSVCSNCSFAATLPIFIVTM
jgi:hypothetical protein